MLSPKLTIIERFQTKVKVDGETGCWLWTGAIGLSIYALRENVKEARKGDDE